MKKEISEVEKLAEKLKGSKRLKAKFAKLASLKKSEEDKIDKAIDAVFDCIESLSGDKYDVGYSEHARPGLGYPGTVNYYPRLKRIRIPYQLYDIVKSRGFDFFYSYYIFILQKEGGN